MKRPDPNEVVTERRLEEELNKVATACEDALNAFQRDLISGQSRANLVWNVVNVTLGVLLSKGLITQADIKVAGEDLWKATIENAKRTKLAIKEKRAISGGALIKTPLDEVTTIMSGIHDRMKQQQKEEEDGTVQSE